MSESNLLPLTNISLCNERTISDAKYLYVLVKRVACLIVYRGQPLYTIIMTTLSIGNIFRVTGLCEGNRTVTGGFLHTGQWRGALVFSLIWAWTNVWANTHFHAHYDGIVMLHVCIHCKQTQLKRFVCNYYTTHPTRARLMQVRISNALWLAPPFQIQR